MNTRRVVVTGLGGATSLGLSFAETWTGLVEGRNGVSAITHWDPVDHSTKFASVIRDYKPEQFFKPMEAKKLDLYTQYALIAAEECLKDSAVDLTRVDLERFGTILGTGIGGINAIESEHDELHE